MHPFTGQKQGTALGRHHASVIPQTAGQSKFREGVMAKDSSRSLNVAFGMETIQGSEPFHKGGEL
jgi:hypothetical protein